MISYPSTKIRRGRQDGFSTVLEDAKALFEEQHIKILGEGYGDILSDDALFADYKVAMLKGVDADEEEQLAQLIENSRMESIRESVSGITPISSLSVPTIRKLWPRMSMKNAIPTEAVELPKFSLSYTLPYILRNGERHYLPEAMMDDGSASSAVMGQPLWQEDIMLADFDPGTGTAVDGAAKGFKLLETLPEGAVASVSMGDSIDPDFFITEVIVECALSTDPANVEQVRVSNLRIGTGLQGDIFANVSAYHSGDMTDDVPNAGVAATTDTLFGRLDRVKGVLMLASSSGNIVGVQIKGRLSDELNTRSESVSFEIATRDVTIGTGVHLNAPLPIEFLQDAMAMYNIDGASKVIDIMTNVLALRLDYEMRDFITDAFVRTPTYEGSFDCKPYAQFSGTPKQWREMLKDVIDHLADRIKQDSFYQGGKFVIVGNTIDINLISNVSWSFTSSAGERSGVEVDYSIGAVSGSQRYEVIATNAVPKGAIYLFFVSNQDEQMTYKYFPYSFNIEKGYSDPNASYVPSIMMAKRHKLEVFKDSIAKIAILNNNGDVNFGS
jgi:hypothetical protein